MHKSFKNASSDVYDSTSKSINDSLGKLINKIHSLFNKYEPLNCETSSSDQNIDSEKIYDDLSTANERKCIQEKSLMAQDFSKKESTKNSKLSEKGRLRVLIPGDYLMTIKKKAAEFRQTFSKIDQEKLIVRNKCGRPKFSVKKKCQKKYLAEKKAGVKCALKNKAERLKKSLGKSIHHASTGFLNTLASIPDLSYGPTSYYFYYEQFQYNQRNSYHSNVNFTMP